MGSDGAWAMLGGSLLNLEGAKYENARTRGYWLGYREQGRA